MEERQPQELAEPEYPARPPRLAFKGFLAGLAAAIVMVLLMGFFRFVFDVASFPEILAEAFTRLLPASTFDVILDSLQTLAKTLLFFGLLIGLALAGGGFGLVYASYGRRLSLWKDRPVPRSLILGLLIWAGAMSLLFFSGALEDLPPGDDIPFALTTLASFLGYTLLSTALVHHLWQPSAKAIEGTPQDDSRRAFLKKAGGAAAVLVLGGLAARVVFQAVQSAQPSQIFGTKGQMPSEITPTDQFYVVSKNFFDPSVDIVGWRLEVGGLVQNDLSFNLDELKALPSVEQFTTLICISNQVGGDLVGNARWRGVPLGRLLAAAGLNQEVTEIGFLAADGYTESLPLERALRDEVMVAYEMNGEPLSRKHGSPARLLVPGIYGMKSVKWLTQVVAADADLLGYWQRRGWSDVAIVNTMSRIDVPVNGADLSALAGVTLGGITFAGLSRVDKLEVSVDGGDTWQEAQLNRGLSPLTWQLWTWQWKDLPTGRAVIVVRATDGRGNIQTAQVRSPFPEGATGYHSIRVNLV